MYTRYAGLLAVVTIASLLTNSPAQAVVRVYSFTMNAQSENPFIPPGVGAGMSNAQGTGTAAYDDVAHTLTLSASFSGLTGNVTQTHFHAITSVSGLPDNNPVGETRDQAASSTPNVGIAIGNPSLPGFPLGVNNGVYAQVLDLTQSSIYSAGFLAAQGGTAAGAEAAFAGALAQGRTYWNIHSTTFQGGELRGFPFLIPEPATFALVGLALCGVIGIRRRRN